MKKILVLASVMLFATSMMTFADENKTITTQNQGQEKCKFEKPDRPDFKMPPKGPDFKKRNDEFEKRLNLSEKQKSQAEEMRKQSFEKMKPVMEKMKQNTHEIDRINAENTNEYIKSAKLLCLEIKNE